MDLRPFNMTDLDAIVDPQEQNTAARKCIYMAAINGRAYAAYNGDETPLAVGGASFQEPGVGAVWMVVSDHGRKHPLALCRAIREAMRLIQDGMDLRRLETTIDPNNPAAVRFAEWCGFVREGERRGMGTDWYSIVRDE